MNEKCYYREDLNAPLWGEAILLGCIVMVSGLLAAQLITGTMIGPNPAPNQVLFIIDALMVGVYATFRRLTVVLDDEAVQLSFSWIKNRIPYADIKSIQLFSVSLDEYGGLGLRYSKWGGEAYTNRMGEGIKIYRRGGSPVVFTPEKPRRVMKLIQEFQA